MVVRSNLMYVRKILSFFVSTKSVIALSHLENVPQLGRISSEESNVKHALVGAEYSKRFEKFKLNFRYVVNRFSQIFVENMLATTIG